MAQTVNVRDLNRSFHFARGERIHTENSYKFTPESIARLLQESGFNLEKSWTDPKEWFCVLLARA
jgi:L-histidine Nalpha-methyltransferase